MNAHRRISLWLVGGALLICAIFFGLRKHPQVTPTVRELARSEFDLRDGRLFVKGEAQPFNGKVVETYAAGKRKLEIEISQGQANGLSRGWYDNGQLEVEETFHNGISHGPRTRWHANDNRKSLAQIEQGKVVGEFIEWHANGQMAARMKLSEGHPDGIVEAWHPSGALKSRVRFAVGKQFGREFWPDPALAVAASPAKRE